MKKIYKILLMAIVASSTLFYSCETLELEDLNNPNALSPDQADPNLLLNQIQLNYLFSVRSFNNTGASLSRIQYFYGRDYFANLGPGVVEGPWNNMYAGMIPDIQNIVSLHNPPDKDYSFHIGISKIMQAHVMMMLVDYLGDVVYSQAFDPIQYPFPIVDKDQDVYNAAIGMLDDAIGMLDGASTAGATDLFYEGDTDKWIKFAKTLKMRADLTVGNYQAVVDATGVILSTEDDMEFKYGTNQLQPDNRHPNYIDDYRSDGANIYVSNWLVDLMVGDFGDFSPDTDPRRRYYFYRQTWGTPGNYALTTFDGSVYIVGVDPDGESLSCSIEDVPAHLEFTPDENLWCNLPLGYWGRTHGNQQGIPPDAFTRTASGVYPAGGSFDATPDAPEWLGSASEMNKQFPQFVALGAGGGGAGITPIMLASYVHFMKAEAYLHLGDAGAAATHMETGMRTSIAKVMSFGALDSGADFSQAPDDQTVEDFVNLIMGQFTAAPMSSAVDGNGFPTVKDKMDLLGEQYFVAMFGAGSDAYNFIRRTGYPRTLARNIEPDPGKFPRTMQYPSSEITTNPNIQQRQDLSTLTFWDQGIENPAN